ncbi:MAG: serine/threonine protein kinase [Cyanobacteria bacterium]|nr:serine/threonine protein kinase [Cyanobacteriota bacterium]
MISDTGIGLPSTGSIWHQQRPMIPWKSVERIAVTNPDKENLATLVIYLKMDKPIQLKLRSLTPENLDKMVSACDLWADKSIRDNTFQDLLQSVTRKRIDCDDSSFTALWMEEAQRRLSSTPFEPLAPGATLQDGRVKVVQPLTAGGWSAIYLCTWKESTQAILKEAVVPPGAKEEVKKKAHEQFEREAVILAGLDHPQIAKVIDYFIENGRQYMVLRRVTGANLRSYIKDKGAVSEKQTLKWLNELAEIVGYLHTQNPPVVHRDITPENLVLDMKGSIVLIDFGAANEFVGTVTGTLVGKPSYISPEQFSGHATLRSDLYSIGAVMYFMLVGEDPEALTVASARSKNELIDEELNKLIADLMQLDVTKRLENIELLKERLKAIGGQSEAEPSENVTTASSERD